MCSEAFTRLLLPVSTNPSRDWMYCDFILYAASGPDSVERIPRGKPLIEKILSYLTTLWTLVTAPEVFEMRVPRDLNPFILTEPVES